MKFIECREKLRDRVSVLPTQKRSLILWTSCAAFHFVHILQFSTLHLQASEHGFAHSKISRSSRLRNIDRTADASGRAGLCSLDFIV